MMKGFLFMTLLGMVSAAITPSTLSCDAETSCSPTSCVTSSDPDCSWNRATPSWATKVAEMTCKTCTQITTGKCAEMASKLSANSGIKAAYCNADFLVVWATGQPSYNTEASNDYLKAIPLPPGYFKSVTRKKNALSNDSTSVCGFGQVGTMAVV